MLFVKQVGASSDSFFPLRKKEPGFLIYINQQLHLPLDKFQHKKGSKQEHFLSLCVLEL